MFRKGTECKVRYTGILTVKQGTSYLTHRIYLDSLVKHPYSFPFSYKIEKVYKEMLFTNIRFTKPKLSQMPHCDLVKDTNAIPIYKWNVIAFSPFLVLMYQ